MTEGEDIFNVWWDPVERILDAVGRSPGRAAPRAASRPAFNAGEGSTLPERDYALSVFVGGTLRQVTFMQTEVQSDQPAGSFNVVGRVIDADTGEPIEFAFVTLLKPGDRPRDLVRQPRRDAGRLHAITDENGEYSTEPPVAPAVLPVPDPGVRLPGDRRRPRPQLRAGSCRTSR